MWKEEEERLRGECVSKNKIAVVTVVVEQGWLLFSLLDVQ